MIKEDSIQTILAPQTQEICKPLFDSTDITYFHHARIYHDGRTTSLNTSPRWLNCYMDEGHYKNADYYSLTRAVTLVSAMPSQHAEAAAMRTHCNLDHKFDITVKTDEYLDVFGFATHAYNDKIIGFYFHNMDLLKRFTEYFLEASQTLQSTLLSPGNHFHYPDHKKIFFKPAEEKKARHDSFVFNRHSLKKAALSPKEHEVLLYLQQGYASKDIARAMDISTRTAESHIFRLKKRLGVYSKYQLIQDIKPLRTA